MNFNYLKYNENVSTSYLKDVYEAINRIEPSYYQWNSRTSYIDDRLKIQMLERVFAYELYHQLRIISPNNDRYANLRIDAEIQKVFLRYDEFETSTNLKYPDIVIHESQENINAQKVIIEIKVVRHGIDDIHKLLDYVKILNFEFGVYVCANIILEEMIYEIHSAFEQTYKDKDFKKIIILTCHPIHGVKLMNLYKILWNDNAHFGRIQNLIND